MIQSIPISAISSDGLQIRVSIDERTVADYAEAIQSGAKLPPVVVFHSIVVSPPGIERNSAGIVLDEAEEIFFLADGFHRVEACRRLGRKTIKADVRAGDKTDALKYALSANSSHGLRRTNADKQNAVKVAWDNRLILFGVDNPSSRAIADTCGVSHTFVDSQLATVASCRPSSTVGKDGRERPLPPLPQPPPSSPPPSPDAYPEGDEHFILDEWTESAIDEPPSADVPPPLPPPPPKSIPVRKKTFDQLGVEVPPELLPVWNRRDDLDGLLSSLSSVRVALRKAQASGDKLFLEVNFSGLLPLLDRAYCELSATKPFAVCPICQGYASDGCKACKGRGCLGKDRYYRVIPPELQRKR